MERQIKVMRPKSKTKAQNNEVPVSVKSFSKFLSCPGLTWGWSPDLLGKGSQSIKKTNMLTLIFTSTRKFTLRAVIFKPILL